MSGTHRQPSRLYIAALPQPDREVTLGREASHHARVLRLSPNDSVLLFDGSGGEMDASVTRIADDGVVVVATGPTQREARGAVRVCLIQALPKAKKLDTIVRMVTEIGVDEIHLAESERSIVRREEGRSRAKLERLERIAREAARQSRRTVVPSLHPAEGLLAVAHRAPEHAAKLVFWEEANAPLPERITADDVWVVIGPEGGMSHTEVEALRSAGYEAVRLGATTLRVETAAPVAIALVVDRIRRSSPG